MCNTGSSLCIPKDISVDTISMTSKELLNTLKKISNDTKWSERNVLENVARHGEVMKVVNLPSTDDNIGNIEYGKTNREYVFADGAKLHLCINE